MQASVGGASSFRQARVAEAPAAASGPGLCELGDRPGERQDAA